MGIELGNLDHYRSTLIKEGAILPLERIETDNYGLLSKLPLIASDKKGWPWTEEVSPNIYDCRADWPKLTIVTPSFNQGMFIEETIRSILLQNYPNLEFIVIDGGSNDQTIQILEKYSSFISYWQCEKDNGQGQAINMGFSIASGNYYAWINSDDYYLRDTFFTVISKFITTKASFIYGYAYNFHTKDGKHELIKPLLISDYFIRIPTLAQPSCFWDARIHLPIWEKLSCSLDYELWLRMVKGARKKLIRQPLAVANVHDAAKTSNPAMDEAWGIDHKLICSNDAHGPIPNWDRMVFINRILLKLINLLR
ncbi:glycosyltransferase [Pedobacter frigidisoli]|uniref:Glycosyltransferase n=1 Tax=Pedobacter frigidisoli TaxID=2530455 RepID=A0A4R0NZ39_9SPHI|nr:glycosyltransferase family 2 protein [Pedobacter frigidisoli]TCD07729.1 glycosyltransferase [Pedobacter frigidisoli]